MNLKCPKLKFNQENVIRKKLQVKIYQNAPSYSLLECADLLVSINIDSHQ